MAELQFVDFALMPCPVRKEKQFSLPDDFSKIDVTILSRTSHPASGFLAVSRYPQNFLRYEREARNFNIFTLRRISKVEIVAH